MENDLPAKERLDKEMHRRGVARSRSAALDLIKRGRVLVNGRAATKPSVEVGTNDRIEVEGAAPFVGRAGEKLDHALSEFDIDVAGVRAIDIGASTGGFTECLLRRGAAHVVAVDVGADQLDPSLRDDPRVEVREGTDARTLSRDTFDIATIDVSFISLEHMLPKAYELIRRGGAVITLVKPQFEVGKEIADKNKGVITSEIDRAAALDRVKKLAKKAGFKIVAETASPIEGEKGNREFLLHLKKG